MNLKKLLPIDHCTFTTHLSSQEVLKKISGNIQANRPLRIPFFYEPPFEKPYWGKISDNTFTIRRNVEMRITYLPVIKGHVFNDAGKTKVEIKMKPETSVCVSTAIILFVLAFVCLNNTLFALSNAQGYFRFEFFSGGLILFGAFIVIVLWATVEFRFQAKKSKSFLQKLVEDEDAEPF
jgi:hypothetical protein